MKYLNKITLSILLATPMAVMAGPLVNLNDANRYELEDHLIGMTEETAQSIVDYRKENGKFNSLEQVLNVEGIERDFLNINRDYIHLGNNPRVSSTS